MPTLELLEVPENERKKQEAIEKSGGKEKDPILLLPPFYAELYNNGMEGWKETFDRLNWIGGTSATKERR